MKFVLFLALGLLFNSASATPFYAEVTVLKGQASQLSPGTSNPTWLKRGDRLTEDTSILTRDKSFIKLKVLSDGSSITLGPKSKIVLNKVRPKERSIVTLLIGNLKAKVIKESKKKHNKSKLYIKTPSAALGVRGTEFIVVVNQQNKVTSLVTLEGEVAMAKSTAMPSTEDIESEVTQAVDNNEATLVRKGRASTSYLHKAEVTAPQKVNPAQLMAMKSNDTLDNSTKAKAVKSLALTEEEKKDLYAPDTEEELQNNGEVPKNGGFVDFNSAIFIPPTTDTLADLGTVDSKTGQYIPSKGIKLDVHKGFVAINNSKTAKKTAAALNRLIEYKPLPKDYAPGHDIPIIAFEKKRRYGVQFFADLHRPKFVTPQSESSGDNKATTFKGMRMGARFLAEIATSPRRTWLFHLGLNLHNYDRKNFENPDKKVDEDETDHGAFSTGIGMRYQLSSEFIVAGRLIFEHDTYLQMKPDNQLHLYIYPRNLFTPKIDFEVKTPLNQNWSLLAGYTSIFPASNNEFFTEGGKAMRLGLTRLVGTKKNHSLNFITRYKTINLEQTTYRSLGIESAYSIFF